MADKIGVQVIAVQPAAAAQRHQFKGGLRGAHRQPAQQRATGHPSAPHPLHHLPLSLSLPRCGACASCRAVVPGAGAGKGQQRVLPRAGVIDLRIGIV